MTISSENRKTDPFVGNDSLVEMPFEFKVFTAADVLVVDADSEGTETVLTLTTDYTVALNSNQNSNPGGTVTRNSALATGYTAVVASQVTPTQQADITNAGGFYPAVITDALDRLTILIQQLQEEVDRCAKLGITSAEDIDALLADVQLLADNLTIISTVASNLAGDDDIGTVAGSIAAVQTAADNIAAILAAPDQATAAATAQGLAEDAQGYAEEWATKAEDSPVSVAAGGNGVSDYSALHHAVKAAASATAAALSAASVAAVPARNTIQNQEALSQGESTRQGMTTITYTGNATVDTDITGGPDLSTPDFGGLVWVKCLTSAYSNVITDSVRGIDKVLVTSSTAAQISTTPEIISSFNANGFTLADNGNSNASGEDYVAWCFPTTKKFEPTFGPNLVTNGGFDSDVSDWVASGLSTFTWNASGYAQATDNSSSTGVIHQEITGLEVGEVYLATVDVLSITGGTGQIKVYDSLNTTEIVVSTVSSAPKWEVSFVATETSCYLRLELGTTATAVSWDNISLKKVTDYLTSSNKPVYGHVNPDMGFGIYKWEGDGGVAHSFKHNMPTPPEVIFYKKADGAVSWAVYSSLFQDQYLLLNTSDALQSSGVGRTIVTETDIHLPGDDSAANATSGNYVGYAFSSVPGVCKVGKFIGSGAGGNYVDCGFGDKKAAWFMIKNLSGSDSWIIFDAIRGDGYILANSTAVETAGDFFDAVKGGFVSSSANAGQQNAINNEYLYIAFAEDAVTASSAYTNYSYPTTSDVLSIVEDTLLSYASGFNEKGEVDNQESVAAGVTMTFGAGYENGKYYIYKDKDGSYGRTLYRPLEGETRDDADKWGEQSPLDESLRTTARHFGYQSPTGVVSASGEQAATSPAWAAFSKDKNDVITTSYSVWRVTSATTSWLQYKHDEPRVLKSWRFRENDSTRSPKRFTIEGSNNGSDWIIIDSAYSGSDYTGNGNYLWGDLQSVSSNTTTFLYHRINITENNGDASYTEIAELEFNTVSPSDYYLVGEGVMYDSSDTPIQRVYLGNVTTDGGGNIIAIEQEPVAKIKALAAAIFGDLTVFGKLNSEYAITAKASVDASVSPPLPLNLTEIALVSRVATGRFRFYFAERMDHRAYSVAPGALTTTGTQTVRITEKTEEYFQLEVINNNAYYDPAILDVIVSGGRNYQ